MFGSDDDTLPEWKRLATEFGRLHGESPQIRLHAERCGELREERGTELSRTLPTVRRFDGCGGCVWWFDVGEEAAGEFLKLVDAAGNLMSRTKSRMKIDAEGRWTGVEHGLRELSPTAQWFRELFSEARTARDTEATPRGDCLLDAIRSSQLVCSERADSALAFRKLIRRADDEFTVKTWRGRGAATIAMRLQQFDDSMDDWYPKPTPDITAARPPVPFAIIADELWQCWGSVLYGVGARLLKFGTDTKRDDWLTNTYRPELCGCLKRVYAALPYDADLADCAPEHRPALRGLNQLVNRLWSNRFRILEEADEARFGEMVATFDRIRSQIETPAPIAGGEATETTGQGANERQPGTLAGGDDVGGRQQSSLPPRDVQHKVPISGNSPANMATIVLMTVNNHETQALLDEFEKVRGSLQQETKGGVTYNILGSHGGCQIVHTLCEMGAGGIGASQQRTSEAIDHWKPQAIIAVGIAFGVDESKQKIGDVLVSTHIQDYELGRLNEDGTLTSRGDKSPSSQPLLNRFRMTNTKKCRDGEWPTVRFGLVLSGQKLVDNLDYRENLKRDFPEAIGGEMEGSGVYASAHKAKVDWIVVKAICDWAHNKNHAEKDAWQQLAAKNAARVLKAALDAGGLYEDAATGPAEPGLRHLGGKVRPQS